MAASNWRSVAAGDSKLMAAGARIALGAPLKSEGGGDIYLALS